VTVLPSRALQVPLATFGALLLGGLLVAQTWKDLTMATSAWYFRTTPVWLIVMAIASVIYLREVRALARSGVDLLARFATLPPE
jgi:APA family basic amino acid/polyamine antiporter